MTRTLNRPPLGEAATSLVMMMSKVSQPPNNTQETLSFHLRAGSLHSYLLRLAHNHNHQVARALNKAILLQSPTTTPTRRISTTAHHTTRATVFPNRSSSIPRCSSPALQPKALDHLPETSKDPARCSPSRTIMVVDFMVNNTNFRVLATMTSGISTTQHSTTTRQE